MSNLNPKIIDNVRLIQKCLIIGEDGKILALRRDDNDHSRSGAWDLPGGGYERGEEVVSAIKREIMEEVGLTANSLYPVYFASKIGAKLGLFAGDTVFATCYVCSDWKGTLALSEEHVEYKWLTPKEFKDLYFAEDDGFFVDSANAYLSLPSLKI